MKIPVLLFFVLLCAIHVSGQETKAVLDVFYGDKSKIYTESEIESLSLDINFYPNKVKLPVIIFLHGGGLTSEDKYVPNSLYNNNLVIVDPKYRLSPFVKCPTYIDDAAASVAWVFKNISQYGGDSTKIYLSGFSAGAFLANMIFWDKSYLRKYNIDSDSLAGFLSISGQMTTHFTILNERGITAGSDSKFIDKFSPLYNVRKTNVPVTFVVGDRGIDMAGRYQQNDSIFKTLQQLGCKNVDLYEYKGFGHDMNLVDASLKMFLAKKLNIQDSIVKINSEAPVKINGFNGFIEIENITEINNLVICNLQGQVIYSNKFMPAGKYVLNAFKNSMAIIRFQSGTNIETKKIVIH